MKKAKCSLRHAEASPGVHTRARTKKLSSPSDLRAIGDNSTVEKGGDGCYLQLRSRRLERRAPALAKKPKKLKISAKENEINLEKSKVENEKKDEKEEGSFGDNEVDLVNKERITRESTPNNLIVGSDIIKSPMSSNKTTTANINTMKKLQIVVPKMPSAEEVEEFLAEAEKKQIEKFIEEYNFDPVNEKPLKGRYEWEEIKP